MKQYLKLYGPINGIVCIGLGVLFFIFNVVLIEFEGTSMRILISTPIPLVLTVPNNKILTFGGDDKIVENLIGHAFVARKGIAQALTELVTENWITTSDALDLVDNLMYKNAEKIFEK